MRLGPVLPAIAAAVGLLALTTCSGSGQTADHSAPATSSGRPRTTSTQPATPSDRSSDVRIQLTLDGHPVQATLNDSLAARDFAALLPLSLDLENFPRTERVADLPRELDISGAPDAPTPQAGDLAHYTPGAAWPSSTATVRCPRAWSSSGISTTARTSTGWPPPTASPSNP
ncbi:cyclophilin-like fold protein [Streptomyces sp. NPDC048417]|uniref:cyclophilin-like fold protein n=1 Tax=Streptomyces sp. NPDC048417 TaxID=3155387 RepID=UPI00342A0507